MKGLILSLILLGGFQITSAQTIAPAPDDKAVVYFVRPLGIGGNITFFDGDVPIGRFKTQKYIRYECTPGERTFWSSAENISFIESSLEAGKIYFIDAVPDMYGYSAIVNLRPIDPSTHKLRRIQRLLSKRPSEAFTKSELIVIAQKARSIRKRSKEKLARIKKKNREIKKLTADMSVTPEQMVFVEKSRTK